MTNKTFNLFLLTILSVFLLTATASAAVTPLPSSLTANSLPSDDTTTRTAVLSFNITNNAVTSQSINLTITGSSGWTAVLSKSTDSLAAGQTGLYTLTLTVPKYSKTAYSGTLNIIASNNGTQLASSTVTVNVDSLSSLVVSQAPATLTKTSNSTTLKIKNDGNEIINNIAASISSIKDAENNELDLTLSSAKTLSSFSLNTNEEAIITVFYTEDPEDIDLMLGTHSTNLVFTSASANKSVPIAFENDFCDYGKVGSDVEIIGLKDTSSDNDWEWSPLDEVEIEVNVENQGNDDDDFTVELMIYDPTDGSDIYSAEETISINEDDNEKVYFTFEVPANIPDDARVYVKAYLDGSEDEECYSGKSGTAYEDVEVQRESREVLFSDTSVSPSTALCGNTIQLKTSVYNTGKSDEDKVLVRLFNAELGVDLEKVVSSLDKGDDKALTFEFTVPENAEEKTYQLLLSNEYNYKKNTDSYLAESEDFDVRLVVDGGCSVAPEDSVLISANLDSEAKAGEQMAVRVSITNLGKQTQTFTILPFGHESWSVFNKAEPSSVTISAGETGNAILYLTPNKGVSGEQRFSIKALFGEQVFDQSVSVFVSASSSGSLKDKLAESFSGNSFIWIIVIANIILIIIIIIAAIRIARR